MVDSRIDAFERKISEHSSVFYGERDENQEAYSESHTLNSECAKKLEKALDEHFNGYNFDVNAVLDDMKEYGDERTSIILANTLRLREGDGRFSAANREWAQNIDLPASALSRHSNEFVESHSVKVDAFVNAFRERGREREMEISKSHEAAVSHEAETIEQPEASRAQEMRPSGPNMAEVQAAEMKASVVQGLDKSADGNTQIEGQDVGYAEEGYVAAANEVKYEAQRARTEDGEQRIREAEKREESITPRIGQRVTFQPHNAKAKLTGKVVDMDDETVTLQSGRAVIPAIRNGGVFTEAREPEQSHTK